MNGSIMIVCGGTGGHLAPGIATAQQLMDAGVLIRIIVSEKEIDSRLLRAYPEIPYSRCCGSAFGFTPVQLAKFLVSGAKGLICALGEIRRQRPVVVLAFGGFLTVNFVIAARILGVPVVLHEANRKVGRSIRMLADLADMNFVPEGIGIRGVSPRRLRTMGMPLRKEVLHIPKEKIREQMNLPRHAKVLVVAGGSQGAQSLNEWVVDNWPKLSKDRINVIVITGPGKSKAVSEAEFRHADESITELRVIAFSDAMHELFSCADLVVSRAGAGSIAELVQCLTPSILIPYPYAADDHQAANARNLEQRGCSVVLPAEQLPDLYQEVHDLIYSDWMLERMRSNMRRIRKKHVAADLAMYLIDRYIGPRQLVVEHTIERAHNQEVSHASS